MLSLLKPAPGNVGEDVNILPLLPPYSSTQRGGSKGRVSIHIQAHDKKSKLFFCSLDELPGQKNANEGAMRWKMKYSPELFI